MSKENITVRSNPNYGFILKAMYALTIAAITTAAIILLALSKAAAAASTGFAIAALTTGVAATSVAFFPFFTIPLAIAGIALLCCLPFIFRSSSTYIATTPTYGYPPVPVIDTCYIAPTVGRYHFHPSPPVVVTGSPMPPMPSHTHTHPSSGGYIPGHPTGNMHGHG